MIRALLYAYSATVAAGVFGFFHVALFLGLFALALSVSVLISPDA